jgi:opacity protein-like surface antigen
MTMMTFFRRAARGCAVLCPLWFAHPAVAADIVSPPTPDLKPVVTEQGWAFTVEPYFWMAGMNGRVGVRGLSPADINVDFSQIFNHIDWSPPPVMLAGEARNGRYALFTDFIYLGLEADGTSSGPLALSAEADMKTLIWTFGGSYRLVDNGTATLDVLAGGRLWHLDSDLTVTGPLAVREASGSKTWVDPLIGVAGDVALGNGFGLHGEADVGGFGVGADIDWQVQGTLQYRYSDSVTLEAGYRYLAVDYDSDGFVFDVAMQGPIIGAKFRF